MKQNLRSIVLLLSLVLVISMLGGCKTAPPIDVTTDLDSDDSSATAGGSGEGLPEVDLESLLFEPGSKYGLQTVYFDYNSSSLRSDSMSTLRENAEKIKQVPGVMIQVAGHCDSRGTQEYNLALGERRALAVRQYLIQLGIGRPPDYHHLQSTPQPWEKMSPRGKIAVLNSMGALIHSKSIAQTKFGISSHGKICMVDTGLYGRFC